MDTCIAAWHYQTTTRPLPYHVATATLIVFLPDDQFHIRHSHHPHPLTHPLAALRHQVPDWHQQPTITHRQERIPAATLAMYAQWHTDNRASTTRDECILFRIQLDSIGKGIRQQPGAHLRRRSRFAEM